MEKYNNFDFDLEKIKLYLISAENPIEYLEYLIKICKYEKEIIDKSESDFEKVLEKREDYNKARLLVEKVTDTLEINFIPIEYFNQGNKDLVIKFFQLSVYFDLKYQNAYPNYHEFIEKIEKINNVLHFAEIEKISIPIQSEKKSNIKDYKIHWHNKSTKKLSNPEDGYSKTDLIELITALLQSNAIEGNNIDFIKGISELLNIDLSNFYTDQKKMSGREKRQQFLEILIDNYNKWYEHEYLKQTKPKKT